MERGTVSKIWNLLNCFKEMKWTFLKKILLYLDINCLNRNKIKRCKYLYKYYQTFSMQKNPIDFFYAFFSFHMYYFELVLVTYYLILYTIYLVVGGDPKILNSGVYPSAYSFPGYLVPKLEKHIKTQEGFILYWYELGT